MNKIFLILSLFVILNYSSAQGDSTQSPSSRFRIFPPTRLMLADSLSFFTNKDLLKNKSVMLMVFNPDCDHCQHETEEIIKHIDKFTGIQIVMTTSMPFDAMMAFREKYKLADYKNITVAQDTHYFLPSYYMISNLPFLAFYNKKKELISVFEGTMPMTKALEELKK